jgi:hypothetical protein
LRASGQFAMTWQIARQQESATVGHQLVGSSGEFFAFYASLPRKSSKSVVTPGGWTGSTARKLGRPPCRCDWGAWKDCSFEQPRLRKKEEPNIPATCLIPA